jgi:hypothetical protein
MAAAALQAYLALVLILVVCQALGQERPTIGFISPDAVSDIGKCVKQTFNFNYNCVQNCAQSRAQSCAQYFAQSCAQSHAQSRAQCCAQCCAQCRDH